MNLSDKIFREVSRIPKGKVVSYKFLADKFKTSPRAVAKILSTNKNPINIPCHRVIRSDKKIGGYTYKKKKKPKMKIKLLKKEGVKIKNNKIIEQ